MTERASVTQGVQLGVEATPGDGAAAELVVNSFTVEPGIKVDMQKFRPTGQKVDSIIVPGKEWVQCKLTGLGSYTEMQYLLAGVLGSATAATPAFTPDADGAAELWKFKLNAREPDEVQTYSFEQGDSDRAHKFAYGLLQELDLTFSRDSVEVGGQLVAQQLQDDVTLTANPTTVPEVPILAKEVDVYLDATHAGLGSTKLQRAFKATFKLGSKVNPVWTLNSAEDSFASHVETAPAVTLALLMEANDEGMAQLPTMRAGDTVFVRVKATSPVDAAVGKPYQFTLDLSGKIADVSEFSDEDGVYAIEWTLGAVYDAASGLALEATLRNAEIALAPPIT
jgi:hypothetical protein